MDPLRLRCLDGIEIRNFIWETDEISDEEVSFTLECVSSRGPTLIYESEKTFSSLHPSWHTFSVPAEVKARNCAVSLQGKAKAIVTVFAQPSKRILLQSTIVFPDHLLTLSTSGDMKLPPLPANTILFFFTDGSIAVLKSCLPGFEPVRRVPMMRSGRLSPTLSSSSLSSPSSTTSPSILQSTSPSIPMSPMQIVGSSDSRHNAHKLMSQCLSCAREVDAVQKEIVSLELKIASTQVKCLEQARIQTAKERVSDLKERIAWKRQALDRRKHDFEVLKSGFASDLQQRSSSNYDAEREAELQKVSAASQEKLALLGRLCALKIRTLTDIIPVHQHVRVLEQYARSLRTGSLEVEDAISTILGHVCQFLVSLIRLSGQSVGIPFRIRLCGSRCTIRGEALLTSAAALAFEKEGEKDRNGGFDVEYVIINSPTSSTSGPDSPASSASVASSTPHRPEQDAEEYPLYISKTADWLLFVTGVRMLRGAVAIVKQIKIVAHGPDLGEMVRVLVDIERACFALENACLQPRG